MIVLKLIILLFYCISSSSGLLNCGSCSHGPSLVCPSYFNKQFEVKLFVDAVNNVEYLEVSCQFQPSVNYSLLRDCLFPGVKTVKFKLCPFTNDSIANTLSTIGVNVNKVDRLYIYLPNSSVSGLLSHHLEGLTKLTVLNLDETSFTFVDENVFQSTPNLKILYLRGNNLETLSKETFRPLTNLSILNLNHNNFTHLPAGLFDNLKELENLYLWKNRLKSLPQNLFANVTLLKNLTLLDNKLNSLREDLFATNVHLSNVNFMKNEIGILSGRLFESNPNLKSVKFSSNKIDFIPSDLFASNTGLESVNFKNNRIKYVNESLFSNLSSLVNIDLSTNELKALPPSLFATTKAVKEIDLSNNRIESLSMEVFQNTNSLISLNLRNNNLTNLPDGLFANTASLEKLILSKNRLNNLSFNTFRSNSYTSLKEVDFSYNNLRSENIFTYNVFALNTQQHLENVDFSHNNFTGFPAEALFFNFLKLKVLNFEENYIRGIILDDLLELAPNVKVNLKFNKIENVIFGRRFEEKTIYVFLEGNNFSCNCQLYDFISMVKRQVSDYTKYNYVNGPDETTEKPEALVSVLDKDKLACRKPTYLSNQTLINVDPFQLTCKLKPEECSSDCPCFYRNFDNMIVVNCKDKYLKSIPNITYHPKYNYTLDLTKNDIKSFDLSGNFFISNITLKNNNLSSIDLANNKTLLPPNLKFLDLRENNLTYLDKDFLTQINRTGAIIELIANPWKCDCELKYLHNFVQEHYSKIAHLREIVCLNQDRFPLVDLKEDDVCPFYLEPMVLTSIIVVLILIVLAAVIGTAILCQYKNRIKVWLFTHRMCLWFVTEDELDVDKLFDAFISYSHNDEEFVNETLVPGLENGDPKYRLCLHYRDWVPGESIHHQIMESVHNSRRTLVILSNNFIESSWGQMEFRTAHQQAWEDKTNRVIIIVYGEMPPEESLDDELKHYVKLHTYLRWDDHLFWENLRYAMPHPLHLLPKGRKKKAKADRIELVNGHVMNDNALRV